MKVLFDRSRKPCLIIIEPRIISFDDLEKLGWLANDSVYDLDGVHLGWYKKGKIYNHKGEIVASEDGNDVTDTISTPHLDSEPYKPCFLLEWSSINHMDFFKRPIVYVSCPQRDRGRTRFRYLMQEIKECKEVKLWECRYFDPEIDPGDWIQDELEEVDIFVFVLSISSFRDNWSKHEFGVAKYLRGQYQKPRIVVAQIDSRKVPRILIQEEIFDLTSNVEIGANNLTKRIVQR
jgi:hypothetical protein